MQKIALVFLVSSLFLLSGCTSPFQEDTTEKKFEGCVPGEEATEQSEQCEIDTGNDNISNNFTNNSNEQITQTNATSEQGNATSEQGNGSSEQGNETVTVNYGPQEGMHIQNFAALIHYYNDDNWTEFELYSLLDSNWNSTSNDSQSKWITIVFISTDCPHCWNKGPELTDLYNVHGNQSEFLVMAVNFSSNSDFQATPEEVVAFQEKGDYFGCYKGEKNCNERPGDPHQFPYIDDRNQSVMYDWGVTGTPVYFVIQPDGIVAWNSYEKNGNSDDTITIALERMLG